MVKALKIKNNQKLTAIILLVLGICYFVLFIAPNSSSREGGSVFSIFSNDEFITYPYVEKMLRGGEDIHELWGNLIIYGDYHYGYPFYFFSMLVLLPRRILMGDAFFADRITNMLILRQLINVLPMVLSAGVLVYYKTRFKDLFRSVFLFVLILAIPSVVRSNIWWWHPDAITLLFIALTFLFLQLDEYRLQKFYLFAAATCGMATATKLLGLFFFITIPVYLLIAQRKRSIPWKRIILKAFLFVLIMCAVIVLANPFMWYEGPRNDMLEIQRFKQEEIKEGYTHGDPYYYQKGPQFWVWTIKTWFGSPIFVAFLVLSVLLGIWNGGAENPNIYLATWSLPFTFYALFFVAPKPDHYILPALLPLYLTALDIPYILYAKLKNRKGWLIPMAIVLLAIILLLSFHIYFSYTSSSVVYSEFLIQNM